MSQPAPPTNFQPWCYNTSGQQTAYGNVQGPIGYQSLQQSADKQNAAETEKKTPTQPLECYNCHEIGHIRRACPYLRQVNEKDPRGYPSLTNARGATCNGNGQRACLPESQH